MTSLRKLLICPWFGPMPQWWDLYRAQGDWLALAGYEILIVTDIDQFKTRVRTLLDIDCPIEPGSGKIHDFRPAFGVLFAAELVGYDFWGHTDFDCVYGNVARFMPDERLAELDVFSDHDHYLCGPWALYRNDRRLVDAFMENADWRAELEQPRVSGWVETGFTATVNGLGLRVEYELNHGYLRPSDLRMDAAGRLFEDDREVSFFHFRRSKQWPNVAVS